MFFQLIADTDTAPGEQIRLLLMCATGIRNNETAAVTYGDLMPMEEHPDAYCLWIYKSTVIGGNEVKAGGKTPNANRILPIQPAIAEIILKRRAYIEGLVAQGLLVLPDGVSVGDLPIVCRSTSYLKYCSFKNLGQAGRILFRKIREYYQTAKRIHASTAKEP